MQYIVFKVQKGFNAHIDGEFILFIKKGEQ